MLCVHPQATIFWNLVLKKGLPHIVAVVIVKLAVPNGSQHAPFEPFAGNPADRVSAAVQSTSEGAMAAHNPVFPDCIPAVHPAARSKAKVGWMMSKYSLPLLPERWVGHPDWYDDTTTMDFDVLSRLHPLQGHEPIEKLLQFTRTVANGRVFIGGQESKDWQLTNDDNWELSAAADPLSISVMRMPMPQDVVCRPRPIGPALPASVVFLVSVTTRERDVPASSMFTTSFESLT